MTWEVVAELSEEGAMQGTGEKYVTTHNIQHTLSRLYIQWFRREGQS